MIYDICFLFNLLFVILMEVLRENLREVRIVKSFFFGWKVLFEVVFIFGVLLCS